MTGPETDKQQGGEEKGDEMEGVGVEVTHPKGNTTQTQTRQLCGEGQTRVVLAFNPT